MAELAVKKEILVRQSIAKEDALKKFGERGETYKCELISELEDGHITTYTQGAFTDLCRGPHLTSTAPIKAIKLLSVAGAYWRGQEDRKQMTRIYGITFTEFLQRILFSDALTHQYLFLYSQLGHLGLDSG